MNRMTFEEAIIYIKSLDVFGSVLGLDNMCALAGKLGNPQDDLKFIHVTGTNGKGSVCAFISNILMEAKYKVGSYNSPAVESDIDQFRINMSIIDKDIYANAVAVVKNACDQIALEGGIQPTRFEVETMAAFVAFKQTECDIVVLETGLGGRDDATNIIKNTLVHVFTKIRMDHAEILGDTLEKIAEVKSGIIKSNAPVIIGAKDKYASTNKVIANRASEYGCETFYICEDDIPDYTKGLTFRMKGAYQPFNAAIAIKTIDVLKNLGYNVTKENIKQGIEKAEIPFRFEHIKCGEVDIILDGAHNPDGANYFIKSIDLNFKDRECIFIAGIFKDKDYEKIVEISALRASKIFVIQNEKSARSLNKEELAKTFEKYLHKEADNNRKAVVADSIKTAIAEAIQEAKSNTSKDGNHPVVCCFGSLSWLNEAKKIISEV